MEIKVPKKSKGQQLSKAQQAEIANQQQISLEIQEHNKKVNGIIQDYADKTIYEGTLPYNFSYFMRKAMSRYSDLTLKISWPAFRGIVAVNDNRYTISQINHGLQYVLMSSAEQMAMDMEAYIEFKDSMQVLADEVKATIDEILTMIKAENPLPATN